MVCFVCSRLTNHVMSLSCCCPPRASFSFNARTSASRRRPGVSHAFRRGGAPSAPSSSRGSHTSLLHELMLHFASAVAAECASTQWRRWGRWRWRSRRSADFHVRSLYHPSIRACASTCTDAEFSTFLVPYIDSLVVTASLAIAFGALPADSVDKLLALKTCKLSTGKAPCFPSEALVTMADGTPRPLSALRAGDAIVAASADGTLTTDTVSLLSLADADVQGTTFVVLTTASGRNLTLTPTHHVPVGAACCADLKQAKDVAVGETVYEAVSVSDAVRATQVQKIGTAIKPGLHSPVLSHGTMPIVNGVATSFGSRVGRVRRGAQAAIPSCGRYRRLKMGRFYLHRV